MKLLLNVLAAIALVVIAGLLFDFYKRNPVDAFCEQLPTSATPQEIISLANAAGLWVNPLYENKDSIWVFNQRAPWWRYACIVELQNGRIFSKQFMAAD